MIDRLSRLYRQRRHDAAARAVLRTPPVVPRDDGVIVFSMMGTRVLAPYLVAVKSLMANLGRGRVALLDDGTLTSDDRAVLAHHLSNPEILRLADVDVGPCPNGGTWERLLTVLDLSREAYVIQIDSDVVVLGDVPEVRGAIDAGRCFTLLGGTDAEEQGLLPVAAFRPLAYPAGPETDPRAHVQVQFESRADRLPDPSVRYIRACSGFTGFAPGAIDRDAAYAFSQAAAALVGAEVWTQWGSEQITSNYLIANAHANDSGPVLLPYARYYNFWNDERPDAALAHFVGTHRYTGDAYERATQAAIAAL